MWKTPLSIVISWTIVEITCRMQNRGYTFSVRVMFWYPKVIVVFQMQQTRWTVTLSYFHLLLEKVQPCSPSVQCFSSKAHSEDGQLIYTGSLARAVRGQSYTFPHQYIGAQQNIFMELTLKLRTFFMHLDSSNIKGCSNKLKDRCYIDIYWDILQLFSLTYSFILKLQLWSCWILKIILLHTA